MTTGIFVVYELTRLYSQLFLATIVGYADSQAYGFAALFGLVKDLNLFTETIVNGEVVMDTTKYQLSAGIVSLGAAVVSTGIHMLKKENRDANQKFN